MTASDGSGGLQPARFTGIEGPRWFLRAVFLGARPARVRPPRRWRTWFARSSSCAGARRCRVGAPIPLTLPQTATPETEPEAGGSTLPSPFQRGPEITETR